MHGYLHTHVMHVCYTILLDVGVGKKTFYSNQLQIEYEIDFGKCPIYDNPTQYKLLVCMWLKCDFNMRIAQLFIEIYTMQMATLY